MIFRKIDDHLMHEKYTFELEEKKLIKSEIDVDENFNRIFSYMLEMNIRLSHVQNIRILLYVTSQGSLLFHLEKELKAKNSYVQKQEVSFKNNSSVNSK
jgi:hypothetical protein